MWKQSINFVLGLWLMISSLVVPLQNPGNLEITGCIIALAGFFSFKSWQGIANGLFGTWLFVCGVSSMLIVSLNFIISGVLITFISAWDLDVHVDNHRIRHKYI